MTLDKIKYYIGDNLYAFWTSQTDIEKILKAKSLLELEIRQGLLSECKYKAELKLLEYLTN